MSEVTIRWTQHVAGYNVGDVQTVERTPFIEAVIAAGRVEVIGEAVEVPPVEPEKPQPGRRVRVNPDTSMTSITAADPTIITINEASDDGGTEAV